VQANWLRNGFDLVSCSAGAQVEVGVRVQAEAAVGLMWVQNSGVKAQRSSGPMLS
jgi:hypothetical protein